MAKVEVNRIRNMVRGQREHLLPADSMITFTLPVIPGRYAPGTIDVRLKGRSLEIVSQDGTIVVRPGMSNQVWVTVEAQVVQEDKEFAKKLRQVNAQNAREAASINKKRRR